MNMQCKTTIVVATLMIAGAIGACSDDQAKQADQKTAGLNAQAASAQAANNKDGQGVDPFMAPGTTKDGKYHPVAEGAYPAMGPPVPDTVIAEETKKWDEDQKQLAKMGGPMGMAAGKAQQASRSQSQRPAQDPSAPTTAASKPN